MNEWWLLGSMLLLLGVALPVALYPLRKPKVSLFMLVPILSCFIAFSYWRWGAFPEWQHYMQQQRKQQQIQALLQSIHGPQDIITQLKARLKTDPKSAKGWYLLGRLYASQAQWAEAHDAFAKAYDLKPLDEQIRVNYAQSLRQLNQ